MDELTRIELAYRRRDLARKRALYSPFSPGGLYIKQQRERAIIAMLKSIGIYDLQSLRICEVGCGCGGVLRDCLQYGAVPENLFGVDLLPDRIKEADHLSPNMSFRCGNARQLPYQDGEFDLVLCFTVLSSILDRSLKEGIASEMLRVLKSGGAILWYDYFVNNPLNPDVRGISKGEITRLFKGCYVRLRRVTLAPPITRALVRHSWLACFLLEKIPLLCTHYLGTIRKP